MTNHAPKPIDEGDANRLMALIDAALASGSPVTEIAMDHDGTPCRLVLASGVGIKLVDSWARGLIGEPAPEPKPEPRASSALLAESKKAVGWLIRTRHPDALRFIDPLLAAIEAEEARGPSEVEKTDIMQQRGCLNHVGDPDPTCRICYLTMSDIAEELRDERDEAIKRADGLRSDVDYWQNIVTASVKACGYPGLLHSELFSHVEQLRKERDEALARAEKAEAALSTPPQPNHASNDQPIRWFLCQYGDPYDDCSDTDKDAAIAELCRRALGER